MQLHHITDIEAALTLCAGSVIKHDTVSTDRRRQKAMYIRTHVSGAVLVSSSITTLAFLFDLEASNMSASDVTKGSSS
jgi:hypothetical protein